MCSDVMLITGEEEKWVWYRFFVRIVLHSVSPRFWTKIRL